MKNCCAIEAAKAALAPATLEDQSSADMGKHMATQPGLVVRSITKTKKDRAKVSADVDRVIEFLKHKDTFLRVNSASKKLKKIPLYTESPQDAEDSGPAASSPDSGVSAPADANAMPKTRQTEQSNR